MPTAALGASQQPAEPCALLSPVLGRENKLEEVISCDWKNQNRTLAAGPTASAPFPAALSCCVRFHRILRVSAPRLGVSPRPPPTPGSSQDAASPPPASRAAGLRWPRHLGPGPGRPDRAPLPRPGASSAQSGRAIECAPASSARAAQRRASAGAASEHFLPSAAAGSACRGGRRDGSAPLLVAGRVPSGAARGQRGQARGSSAAPAGTGRPGLGRGVPGGRSTAPGPRAGWPVWSSFRRPGCEPRNPVSGRGVGLRGLPPPSVHATSLLPGCSGRSDRPPHAHPPAKTERPR